MDSTRYGELYIHVTPIGKVVHKTHVSHILIKLVIQYHLTPFEYFYVTRKCPQINLSWQLRVTKRNGTTYVKLGFEKNFTLSFELIPSREITPFL